WKVLPPQRHRQLNKETCDTYCQKQGENPAGEFPPSSTSHHSSEHPRKPRMITKLREDNGSAALGDALSEELEPIPEEALPYRCKKCGSSFRGVSELQEHRRAHLLENSYRCPICTKGFSRAANLRMHKLIHSSERSARLGWKSTLWCVLCPVQTHCPAVAAAAMLHHRELWNLYWEGLHCLALNCFV
uniref:C2H2-type domain-containing protein n=1 Tax=Serinus canaria TaxID=9135 RepID=A0A8C9KZ72_SERCA